MSNDADKKVEADADGDDDDEDLEKLQAEIKRMEEEAARITKETEELEKKKGDSKATTDTAKASAPADAPSQDGHSIYVGQVDYSATPEQLLSHFEACGTVERVTIVCDKFSGRPKGFAYLEFSTDAAVQNACKLDGSEFLGRTLKVHPKRVNVAGFNQQPDAGGRGRGGRGGFRGGRGYRGGFRGRGYRGRGRGGYHPYY
ncbi:unnamed protein product [Cylindrotheca closterium]|uniref:RRM domain-containing protein n=1 Tax=Cylindrotheca closterium TaxID=2856 RepID=A0AAD2G7E6_9STRA|nr:unnamed protein product [Cylindrotheca closterium]